MTVKARKEFKAVYFNGSSGPRSQSFKIDGYTDSEWPNSVKELPLQLEKFNTESCRARFTSTSRGEATEIRDLNVDAPNIAAAYACNSQAWDSRLYAGAYSKFVDAARQGSSEWGMNIVQGRKALETLKQLLTTSATVLTAFAKANQIGIQLLKDRPHASVRRTIAKREETDRKLRRARLASDRRRLSNEIWLLDQITATLLAYRYGVAPLMGDVYQTLTSLSEPFTDNVSLKKTAVKPWNGPKGPDTGPWLGTERVTLKATVSVQNPNLLLANRHGLINPQLWIWDAMPWSFVVDWWLPVGSMLGNLTASVGLTFVDASVTRTREFTQPWTRAEQILEEWNRNYSYRSNSIQKFGDCVAFGKRKERTTGSLPVPLSVPYGTGLSLTRGQNALALSVQLLKGKIKK